MSLSPLSIKVFYFKRSTLLSPLLQQVTSVTCFCTQKYGNHHRSNRNMHGRPWKFYSFCGILTGIATAETFRRDWFSFPVAHAAELDPRSPFKGSGNALRGGSRRSANNFVADVVDIVGKAVVFIERLQQIPFTRKSVAIANGSGFIVDSNGLIITNAHVVGNQSNLNIKLPDGRQFRGRVVGIDESRDIAAVKIDAVNLPVIALGTAHDLRPGEWVIAIGSPLALQNTVTAGIVSNMCRPGKELGLREEEQRDMEYIQTDATINVGNSGGPLVNLDGQAIGINSMMASAGIGFAIPIDCVKQFLQNMQQGRGYQAPAQSRRRWIGITMLSITPEIASQLKHRKPDFPSVTEGVYVHRVQQGSPAHISGMQHGDVITHINDKPIRAAKDVTSCLEQNQVLSIRIRRGEASYILRVVAEELVH